MNWFEPNFNSIQNLHFYTKICFLLLLWNLHLYIYMPINLDFNDCFIPLYFKSNRKQKRVRSKKYNNTGFYIYLCNYIYWDSLFYQVDLSYWLASIYFSPKDCHCLLHFHVLLVIYIPLEKCQVFCLFLNLVIVFLWSFVSFFLPLSW